MTLSPDKPRLVISHSESDSEILCQLRHYYAFGERLQSKRQSISLSRGILGHHFMHIVFKTLKETKNMDAAKKAMDEAMADAIRGKNLSPEKLKTIFYLAKTIEGFLNFYHDRIMSWDIIEVEQTHYLDCGDFDYAFTCDALIRENGRVRVVDWKFVYDFYDDDMVELSPQIPRYIGALRALEQPTSGGLYGFLRYREIKAEGDGNRFLLRPVNPTDDRVKNSFLDLIKSVVPVYERRQLELQEWHQAVRRTSNQIVCKSCAFKKLCVAELNGSDGKLIRQLEYEPSTYGYDNTSEE